LKPSPDTAETQKVFSDTVQMGTDGAGAEQGIAASIRAIERSQLSGVNNAPNRELFRADAALAILVVSDAYDTSGKTPQHLIDLVKTTWPNKAFSFHSIVIPESQYTTPDSGTLNSADPCKSYRESAKYDGRTYHVLSTMTGGIKGTACTEDYSAQLDQMGQSTASLVNSATLTCQPVDRNGDGTIDSADVTVLDANGQAITTPFMIAGNRLTFATALPVGTNSLTYYCIE
jgi:hypothetical protein